MQIQERNHFLFRPRHQIDRLDTVFRHDLHVFFHHKGILVNSLCHQAVQLLFQRPVSAFLQRYADIIGLHLPKLLRRHIGDGILDTEARDQQCCASADSHHHHKQPLFIAKDVPQGNLMQKAQPLPQKRNPLQKHTFPRFRRFGPHQGRRHLIQLHPAGQPGSPNGAQQRYRQGNHRQLPVKDIENGVRIIHHSIAEPYHFRKPPGSQKESEDTACHRSQPGVNHIF